MLKVESDPKDSPPLARRLQATAYGAAAQGWHGACYRTGQRVFSAAVDFPLPALARGGG